MKKILILLSCCLCSCIFQENKPMVKPSFKLNMGYGENEIGNFAENQIVDEDCFKVFYRSGFYYIADSKNNKIMKITENGIHTLILYNPENNPQLKPTILKNSDSIDNSDEESEVAYVKLYKEYPIVSPLNITADIEKNIYVVNRDPAYKKITDDGIITDLLVLKFDKKGNLLFKLGRDGINTMPFGYIAEMVTDTKNNLVINELSKDGNTIYHISKDGILQSKTKFNISDIPLTQKEQDLLVDIIDSRLGYIEDEIYITCQYVKQTVENFSITKYETMYEKILKFSLKNHKIEKMLMKVNPQYLDLSKIKSSDLLMELYGNKKRIMKPLENLIGVDEQGNIYFSQKELPLDILNENNQRLYIYDATGKLKDNITVKYPLNIQYLSDQNLSPEGRIFSYYILNGAIEFVAIN